MSLVGPILALLFIVLVARLLLKSYHPHAVLLIAGLLMLSISIPLGLASTTPTSTTGNGFFDLFQLISQSFSKTLSGVGLMIMAIGGFVAYIDKIGASNSLVDLAMKPLGLLKKFPQAAAAAVIPISQILFAAIPSAAGLSLLLMASIFPILVNLGVSRLTAVSVITAATAIGLGPASAMSVQAARILGISPVEYFINEKLPLFIPLSIVITITYFFVNRYFDSKLKEEKSDGLNESKKADVTEKAPGIYALIPILPILLLLTFSEMNTLVPNHIKLSTTAAMFVSFSVAILFELIRHKNLKKVLASFTIFWGGMGNIFKTVVTLIIAADIFSKGLIALGFIDGLVLFSNNLGFGAVGLGIVMTVMIFMAAMLMGSGNAAFFAFGPLVPELATKFGVKSAFLLAPMNVAASMGRTVSPVAGVIIATAEIAGVTTLQIVRRNLIPLITALLVMILYHFLL